MLLNNSYDGTVTVIINSTVILTYFLKVWLSIRTTWWSTLYLQLLVAIWWYSPHPLSYWQKRDISQKCFSIPFYMSICFYDVYALGVPYFCMFQCWYLNINSVSIKRGLLLLCPLLNSDLAWTPCSQNGYFFPFIMLQLPQFLDNNLPQKVAISVYVVAKLIKEYSDTIKTKSHRCSPFEQWRLLPM